MGLQFEWDEKKAKINKRKHGITFEEATTAFADELSITIDDPLHSDDVRGKYAQAYKEGVNIVKLDRDVMKFFSDTKSVNEALRTLINLIDNGQNPLKLSS